MEALKLSYYTIPVKLESEKDKYLLVHGYTGAIDIVTGDIWRQMIDFSANNLSADAVEFLQERGYLTVKSKKEEFEYVMKLANLFHQVQGKLYKSFGFIVSYDCNFRCPYCFENEISNHGTQWSKRSFSKELVDRAYDGMLKIEPHKELHSKQILLFGGEPFLRENREITEYIIKKGVDNGYSFKAITNGYDINYFENVLSPNNFSLIQITLDGKEEHHNTRRFHYEEGDSYKQILNNIELLLKKEIPVLVRVNTDKNNFNDFTILKKQFQELGYNDSPYFELRSSYLREFDFNSKQSENIDYFPSFSNLLKKHKEEYDLEFDCQDFGIAKHFYSYLKNKSRCRLYSASCSSQYGSFLFDPLGNIYPCLEIIGKKDYIIGTYSKDEIQWTKAHDDWFKRNVGNSKGCNTCKYALLCGGPCLARLTRMQKGFDSFYCSDFKRIFATSVNRAYKLYAS